MTSTKEFGINYDIKLTVTHRQKEVTLAICTANCQPKFTFGSHSSDPASFGVVGSVSSSSSSFKTSIGNGTVGSSAGCSSGSSGASTAEDSSGSSSGASCKLIQTLSTSF